MENQVIFLSFANLPDSPLPLLEQESETIYRKLTDGASKNYYQLHREPFATIEKIAHYLIQFKDRVQIFHYGGHAGSQELILTDQTADAKGIAQLLQGQKNLKLVFLNGCSTEAQVKQLQALNIPVVIATARPIEDQMAADFAAQFYEALAKKHTIKEAFDMASGFVEAQRDADKSFLGAQQTRDFVWSESDSSEAEQGFAWGLFYEEESALDWKLPAESTQRKQIIIRQASDQFNFENSPINSQLIVQLLNSLRPYNKKLDFFLTSQEDGDEVDERILNREIIDCLPAPIGEQVRKLFSLDVQSDQLDKIGVPRLRQLVRTYSTMVEFFVAILFANLWELKAEDENLVIPEETLALIKTYLIGGKESAAQFDYLELIRSILQFFGDQGYFAEDGEKLFVEELPMVVEAATNDHTFVEAITFMQEMRKEVRDNDVSAGEIESFCVQAEEKLAYIMLVLSFMAKYKLSTIKNIAIKKVRNQDPKFIHYQVTLDTITAGYKDTTRDFTAGFTENQSVILLKSIKEFGRYLNLSPFIIDENALKNEEKSKLFFFHWYDQGKDTLHYKYAYVRDDKLSVTKKKYPEVKADMDDFAQLFFGKQLKAL